MTPQKLKRPLPSLPSTSARCPPEHPASFPEWQIALQGVKLLYLKRQYKQCASRCTQLLQEAKPLLHPAHRTFLLFYTALSYELTARSQHNLSTTKIPLLELAKEYYQSAACYLPTPEPSDDLSSPQDQPYEDASSPNEDVDSPNDDADSLNEDEQSHSEDDVTPQDTYSTSSSTPSSPTTPISLHGSLRRSSSSSLESTSANSINSPHPADDDWSPYHSSIFRPSPLRIRKAVHFSPSTSTPPQRTKTPSDKIALSPAPQTRPKNPSSISSPTTPTSYLPHSPTAILLSTALTLSPSLSTLSHPSIPFPPTTSTWLRTRSRQRYNTHLNSLSPLLENHITTINHLLSTTREAQTTRKVSGEEGALGMRERISRLKEKGWERKRFDARRYEELCERALAEL